jgi:hypothetical protein
MLNIPQLIIRNDDYGLVEESPEWWDYWTEEIRRCHEGYSGLNGRYYFFLKFCKIKDIDKGWIPPWYLDFQDELIQRIIYNDSIGRNTGVKKGRRKGYTYMMICAIVIYDMIFNTGIEISWGVGDDETLIASRRNILDCMAHVHPFFYQNTLSATTSLLQFGWTDMVDGRKEYFGNMNLLYMELMSANTGVFKGKALKRSIFEEIGKFKNLKQAFNDTKDCWMKGTEQKGTAILGGTGGAVDKGSRDFMYMVSNAEEFNIDWFFIPAVKGYYPYVSPQGISDVPKATEHWKKQEETLKKKTNKKSLYDFYQNNPMEDAHIFLTLGSGVFNQVLLSQAQKFYEVKPPGIQTGDFSLVDDWKLIYAEKGWDKSMIKWNPNSDGKTKLRYWPDYLGDDITGCDPYNQEKSETSDSKGAHYIYRVTSQYHKYDGDRILLEYFDRPERIKTFNQQVFWSTLFYGTKLDFEANQSAELVSFFEVNNATEFLCPRPKAFDAIKDEDDFRAESRASNRYGRSVNVATKPILVNAIADYIEEHTLNLWTLGLIDELKYFGSKNTDRAMAFGIARLGALDRYAIKGIDFAGSGDGPESKASDIPTYKRVNGQIVLVSKLQN